MNTTAEIAVKERPILFSTPMVNAILSGQKTQTRRAVKPQPIVPDGEVIYEVASNDFWIGKLNGHFSGHSSTRFKCPYGKVGDVLWVRETYALHWMWDNASPSEWVPKPTSGTPCIWYKADGAVTGNCTPGQRGKKWRPSIHMPREACRLRLEITNIRVERLLDISEEDAIAEGCVLDSESGYYFAGDKIFSGCAALTFTKLWWAINGTESWNANPWVWVIEFKVQEGGAAK